MMTSYTGNNSETAPPASTTSRIFSALNKQYQNIKTSTAVLGTWSRDNFWTILNALGNGLGSLSTATYLLDEYVDILGGLDSQGADEYWAELSFQGLIIGVTLGSIITSGSIYAHFVLNTNTTWALNHRLFNQANSISDIDPRIAFSSKQYFLRALDYLSHVADNAATNLFIFDFLQPDPNMNKKIIATLGLTLLGMLTSRQDFFTCGQQMLVHNKNDLMGKLHSSMIDLDKMYSAHREGLVAMAEHYAEFEHSEEETMFRQMVQSTDEIYSRFQSKLTHRNRRDAVNEADEHELLPLLTDDERRERRFSTP